jgi:hypothetical protein
MARSNRSTPRSRDPFPHFATKTRFRPCRMPPTGDKSGWNSDYSPPGGTFAEMGDGGLTIRVIA